MAKILAVLFILALLGTIPGLAVIPEPYYVNTTWNDHTIHGIETLLGGGFTVPYKPGVFDCSEMSAYVEWLLTCHGFDAGFCMDGSGPWLVPENAGYSSHMWVAVRLWNDTTGVFEGLVYIEPTAEPMQIIRFTDTEWSKYNRAQSDSFLGMKNFLSIYDAINGITPTTGDNDSVKVPENEINWWEFGTDLIRPPPPLRGITAETIIKFRASVAKSPHKNVASFKITPTNKIGTIRTV
jgi:hypothetical protein